MLFAGGLPQTFKEAYPFRPLVIRAGTDGNLKEMQISRFTVDLPIAFLAKGGGILWKPDGQSDSFGNHWLDMVARNLNFLTGIDWSHTWWLFSNSRQYESQDEDGDERPSIKQNSIWKKARAAWM